MLKTIFPRIVAISLFSMLSAVVPSGQTAEITTPTFSLTNPSVALGVVATPSTGQIEQFDETTYGTLTQVGITYTLKAVITTNLQNNSDEVQDIVVSLTGSLQLDMPAGMAQPLVTISHTSGTNTLNPNASGVLTSTITFSARTIDLSSDFSVFLGQSTWTYTLEGFLATAVSNNPAVTIASSSMVASLEDGSATYTYSPVPEPSTSIMILLGLAASCFLLRKSPRPR